MREIYTGPSVEEVRVARLFGLSQPVSLDTTIETQRNDLHDGGLCGQTDPDLFFPDKGGSSREAKQVCLSCDVLSDCRTDALENEPGFGVFGAMTEIDRKRYRKKAKQ